MKTLQYEIKNPAFEKFSDGLVPVIIQDAITSKVLMLGYMNSEAFEKTKSEGKVTFFSRSKNRLWTKGEESGNYLEVENILPDCDNDALLIIANPVGPVCHTGNDTCFEKRNTSSDFLSELEAVINLRKVGTNEKSYVKSLFLSGINKIAQKVGEEAVELIIEAKDDDSEKFRGEAADLLFHYLILLSAKGSSLKEIVSVLKKRSHSG